MELHSGARLGFEQGSTCTCCRAISRSVALSAGWCRSAKRRAAPFRLRWCQATSFAIATTSLAVRYARHEHAMATSWAPFGAGCGRSAGLPLAHSRDRALLWRRRMAGRRGTRDLLRDGRIGLSQRGECSESSAPNCAKPSSEACKHLRCLSVMRSPYMGAARLWHRRRHHSERCISGANWLSGPHRPPASLAGSANLRGAIVDRWRRTLVTVVREGDCAWSGLHALEPRQGSARRTWPDRRSGLAHMSDEALASDQNRRALWSPLRRRRPSVPQVPSPSQRPLPPKDTENVSTSCVGV